MGLFSNLLETYDKCSHITGIVPVDDNGKPNARKVFLPLFHITLKTEIHITLDSAGKLVSINRDIEEIIIPCTESSESRSGPFSKNDKTIMAHPLCDWLEYLDRNLNPSKFNQYIEQLNSWKGDNIKLNSIYEYLTKNSIVEDIKKCFEDKEYDSKGEFKKSTSPKTGKTVTEKTGVRFSVQIKDDSISDVWKDKALQKLWIEHYLKTRKPAGFDFLGQELNQIAKNHSRNINSNTPRAKLISCNDRYGLTFRGRFDKQDEAIKIDRVTSQKIHITLKWLINNFGYSIDSQVVVIWSVDSDTNQKISPFDDSFGLFEKMKSVRTDLDKLSEAQTSIDINYSQKVVNLLRGYGKTGRMKEHFKKVVIAIFDAATIGRMGVTFYQEFPEYEYLESAWKFSYRKIKDKDNKEKIELFKHTSCPSFNDIMEAAYGKPRVNKKSGKKDDKSYISLKKEVEKQLIECMFGNFALPKSYMDKAAYRVSRPMSFGSEEDKDHKEKNWDHREKIWRYYLDIACSLTRKYIKQSKKEDIKMELDETRTDRDYLFGRLLSVADRLESLAIYEKNKDRSENEKVKRATNAIRFMSNFQVRPSQTWNNIRSQKLEPYIKFLEDKAFYYLKLIDKITVSFKDGDFESNKPLSPLYLLGYSAQNYAFYKNKNYDNKDKDNKNGGNK
ncbi:MAG: type I-C CRISPR-associated protein Cas8c/Csd1 [Clostridia bacterium]|nr:type I-C CRISPR-associated protein Cas8c/Csd1 [Clostridia bacterium]